MGLDIALDELYATGWLALDTAGCSHAPDGRLYPCVDRVREEMNRAGFALTIRYVDLFDCHRAEWADAAGAPAGAVVGRSEAEAAVYALSRCRRQFAEAMA